VTGLGGVVGGGARAHSIELDTSAGGKQYDVAAFVDARNKSYVTVRVCACVCMFVCMCVPPPPLHVATLTHTLRTRHSSAGSPGLPSPIAGLAVIGNTVT
jgi:hypothetical protein